MKNWKEFKPIHFEMNGRWIKNWFSNMVLSPLVIDGFKYCSVENYYQSQKSLDKNDWLKFENITPSEAKKQGRLIPLRHDWEQIKYEVMKKGLRVKFNSEPWKQLLLDTDKDMIIEWNNWGDKIWGVTIDDCIGNNLLGNALMEIRTELQNEYSKLENTKSN